MRSGTTLAVVLALLSACGGPPQSPAPISTPHDPIREPTIVYLVMDGPEIVPLGESVQYRLIASLSNGSRRDVTTDAEWIQNAHYSFSAPGLVTGGTPGATQITARYQTLSASKTVSVMAPGTFRLYGQVREAGAPEGWGWLPGARVEVVSGVGAGQHVNTGWWGEYLLFGVGGEIRLLVEKPGYEATVHEITVARDNQNAGIVDLTLTVPRANVSGTYSLTIRAADECGSGLGRQQLPEDVRARTYSANVRQEGPTVAVNLGDHVGGFEGKVDTAGQVVFEIAWYDGEAPYFREALAQSQTLVVHGVTVTPVAPDRLAGMLNGWIQVFDGSDYWSTPVAGCFSARHQFVLSR